VTPGQHGFHETQLDLCRIFFLRVQKRVRLQQLSGEPEDWNSAADEELNYLSREPLPDNHLHKD